MRKWKWWIIIPVVLFLFYMAGPNPSTPTFANTLPPVPKDASELELYISKKESSHKLRPDNQARIIWANDSLKQKTRYAILYLHGFTASQAEGDPVHRQIAKKFGCNLYLSRLSEHGIDTTEQLVNLDAERLWASAREALAVATSLGDSVIIMGTSTGGTLALMLASRFPEVYAQVLLSPNIEIFDENARLLNNPWGLQIARFVTGSNYVFSNDTRPVYKQYWNYGYRLEAVVQLQEMLEQEMKPELFKKITQPTLMLYYFKDDVHQDSVVKVNAMLKMFDHLSTPSARKKAVALPKAGNHVLGSYIKSADVEAVVRETGIFMEQYLGMKEQ